MLDFVTRNRISVRMSIYMVLLWGIILLSGCASNGTLKYKINKEEQETEYSTVYAEIIEISGLKDKEFQSDFNLSVADGVNNAIKQFNALAQEAQPELPAGIKSALYITQSIKRNSGGIMSFVEEDYIYLGGAHGLTSWYPKTIDGTGEKTRVSKLGDLFCDKEYMAKLNVIIERMVEENSDKYSELWAKPEITDKNENRFYLTDTELVIFFPPYELSYYAKGFIEFPIPLSDLNPILNEQYRVRNK